MDSFFSGYRVSEIDASLIRKFVSEQQAKGLANGTINRSVSALRRMYYLAKEDDKLRDVPHFPMVDEAPPRKGFFEAHEYEKLLAALPITFACRLRWDFSPECGQAKFLG